MIKRLAQRFLPLLPFIFFLIASSASAQISSLVSPGELSRAHQKFSGIKNCNVCHGSDKNVLESKCLECHKNLASEIAAKKGFHADKAANCIQCHTEHVGKDVDIRQLDLKTFHHDQTGYKLEGFHAKAIPCAACHKTRSFIGLSTDCASCHRDPHKGNLPNCSTCHTVDKPMKQIQFDHSTTHYPLEGAHATVACMTCHKNQVFKGLPFANCTNCHQDPHKGSLGANCTSCHTVASWKQPTVKHEQFPLTGKHAQVQCAACHPGGKWKLTAFSKCADCHKDPHLGQFAQTCDTCHTVNGFKPAKFDHGKFKLELAHAIACTECHKMEKGTFPAGKGQAIRYLPMKTDCASCHKDVHQGQLGAKCETCHNVSTFKMGGFDHSKTRFPLDTVHAKVECAKCHAKDPKTGAVHYKPIETTCVTCHASAHMGQLGNDCTRCHTPTGLSFDHSKTMYPLVGKHATVECKDCHHKEKGQFPAGKGEAIRYKPISSKCATCHADIHKGQFKQDCEACHTTTGFKPTTFTHAKSDFPLRGGHADLVCYKCHKPEHIENPPPPADVIRYRPMPRECSGCHKDPHEGRLGVKCVECHTEQQWNSVSRAFHKVGIFPLTGRHLSVACEACHLQSVIKGTPTRCYDCHWIRRQDDRYRTRLGNDCEKCHNTGAWSDVKYDHAAETGVQLNKQHQGLACDGCHVQQSFTPGEVNCYSCHREDYENTKQPNHRSAGFPTTCENCHKASDTSWQTVPFNHSTVFPLVGVHGTVACAACHKNGTYTGTPRECYGCHKNEYDSTTKPNHRNAGFPTNCDACHKATDANWLGAKFNHNDFFPLVGRHASQTCETCHKNGVFQGTPRDCYGCHKQNYDSTTKPNHKASGFSTNCETCHRPTDLNWQTKFNHNDVFPLAGVHATTSCESCHKNNVFAGTPRNCYGCHKTNYDSTQQPNHRNAGFPTTCEVCHKFTDPSWHQGKFNHSTVFPLVGRHATVDCAACHKDGKFTGTPKACYGCHKANYDATQQPNHRTAGFPTDCQQCHRANDASWNQGKFNHSNVFPLVGAHASVACESCHKNGNFSGTPRDCYGCHKANYDSTNNPNHRNAGFPTNCEACHKPTDTNWNQATFNHNQFFQLIGVHAQQPCAACHKNNVYKGTPTDCYGCHKAQYDSTNNPNHRAAGFPTNCESCHRASDTSWNQGVFNHDWFPIKSGRHSGFACAACHPNTSNYQVFACTGSCHTQSNTDSHHREVSGYRYDSNSCYHCHPNGTAEGD